MFGLIYAWTNYDGETPGVWISGPGMELGRVFTDPAYAPVWDQDDNSLFFFINGGGSWDLVRLTFPAYNDPTPVAHLSSNAYDVIWVGMK